MKKLMLSIALLSGANLFGAAAGPLWRVYRELAYGDGNQTAFKTIGESDQFFQAIKAYERGNGGPLEAFKQQYGAGMVKTRKGGSATLASWIDQAKQGKEIPGPVSSYSW